MSNAIETDQQLGRHYIPVGNWEIQTKGKGSSFRICHVPTGVRYIVLEERLHQPLEELARDVHQKIEGLTQKVAQLLPLAEFLASLSLPEDLYELEEGDSPDEDRRESWVSYGTIRAARAVTGKGKG